MTASEAEVLRECYELLAWHADDEADEADEYPEDMVAHVNGLVRQRLMVLIGMLETNRT